MSTNSTDPFVPSCSVVICTRDRPTHLDQCLAAVSLLDYPRLQVVVVDNASKDGQTREIAARWHAHYLLEPKAGLSRARNRGARSCDTEIIAFLDDDAVPDPGWLSGLVTEFKDPSVMAVTGRVCGPGAETESSDYLQLIRRLEVGGPEVLSVDRQTPSWFELVNFKGIGIGANMAFRRAAFEVWAGFDERLGRSAPLDGGEELYAFFSLVTRGFRLVYTPHAVVRHPCGCGAEELRTRCFRILRSSTSYITFLFFEEPRFRTATLTYSARRLRSKLGWSGDKTERNRAAALPRWRTLPALLTGPLLYLGSKLTRAK